MIAAGGASYLVAGGAVRRWSASGYGASVPTPADARLLTPPSTLRALAAGYRPAVHVSASLP